MAKKIAFEDFEILLASYFPESVEAYYRALNKAKGETKMRNLTDTKKIGDFVDRAFAWDKTPEEHDYWEILVDSINTKWRELNG